MDRELFEQLGNISWEANSSSGHRWGGHDGIWAEGTTTKDIDIVCRLEEDKAEILRCAGDLGYELVWPRVRHARLGLNRIAVKGGHTLDVFPGKISYDFGLSDAMWERARKQKAIGRADIRYASPEDIFIMKLIVNRPGDVPDCAALVSVGLDFDAVL